MKPGLAIGAQGSHSLTIRGRHTVPSLFPEAELFQQMPDVLATGVMVGLMEWACIELIAPYYEEDEGSLGVHVDFSHVAATPPGLTVTVDAQVADIDGKFIWFDVSAHDGVDQISEGRHKRAVVKWSKFTPRAMAKLRAPSDGVAL